MTEYDLSDCGIAGLGTIEVEGALTKVRIVAGAPIVFLFDEHHTVLVQRDFEFRRAGFSE